MDWLDKEMEELIERCRLDSGSAQLVQQALRRAYELGYDDGCPVADRNND